MRAAPIPARLHLLEAETVVARGHDRCRWLIRFNDAWIAVTDWPGAQTEYLEPGPGTVWERRVELTVPEGTILQQVASRPAPQPCADPLDYLTRQTRRTSRAVVRTFFRVGEGGRLMPRRTPRTPATSND